MIPVLVSLPWLAVVGCLLWLIHNMSCRHADQVSGLCQRVQAPEVAVAQHVDAQVGGPAGLGWVPVDDDDAARADMMERLGVAA